MNRLRQAFRSSVTAATLARAVLPATLAVAIVALPAIAPRAAPAPTQIVEEINAAVIDCMKRADELGYQGRYRRLEPVLVEHFDFPLMARVAVGRHWRELGDARRQRLIDRFTEMSIATFAARFDGYSGQRFRVDGQRPGLRGSVLVDNALVMSDGDSVNINYLLRESESGWQVVDVYLDAKYSELAMKRSEYSSVMRRRGFDGLIDSIEREIGKLETAEVGAE